MGIFSSYDVFPEWDAITSTLHSRVAFRDALLNLLRVYVQTCLQLCWRKAVPAKGKCCSRGFASGPRQTHLHQRLREPTGSHMLRRRDVPLGPRSPFTRFLAVSDEYKWARALHQTKLSVARTQRARSSNAELVFTMTRA